MKLVSKENTVVHRCISAAASRRTGFKGITQSTRKVTHQIVHLEVRSSAHACRTAWWAMRQAREEKCSGSPSARGLFLPEKRNCPAVASSAAGSTAGFWTGRQGHQEATAERDASPRPT